MKKSTALVILLVVISTIFVGCKKTTTPKNQSPEFSTVLNPVNNADSISIVTSLSWNCTDPEGDSLFYDVYFGISANPALVSSEQTSTTYTPTELNFATRYYWKIVAKDTYGNVTTSDVWNFTTKRNGIPNSPILLNPANNADSVLLTTTLSWTCSDPEGDSLSYDVYFGTSNEPVLVSSEQTSTIYTPVELNFATRYYWKILAKDTYGNVAASDLWNFTTKNNNPPNSPILLSPANNADSVAIITTLSWSCSDPEGDSLSYDVYLGTSNEPVLVSSEQTSTTYTPTELNFATRYYWKIVAKDIYGNTTASDVQSFKTKDGDINPENYSFYMGIIKTLDLKSGYMIYFDSANDSINSVELKINNEPIEINHINGNEWYAIDINLTENTAYSFEVNINESRSVSNFSLKTTDLITGNWPENLNFTEAITFNWTMAHDAMHQEFGADAYKYEVLDQSDRSYTMPADYLPSDYDEYSFSVIDGNYHIDSHLLAIAMSYYEKSYGYGKKNANPIKKAQSLIRKFAKSIK